MLEIREAKNRQELNEIYRFRYEVYVEEMHRKQLNADHNLKVIVDPLDESARIYGAWFDSKLVGTTRINYARESELGYYKELYNLPIAGRYYPDAVSITTKLMVSKLFRNSDLGFRIGAAVYKDAINQGIHFDFMDCNKHLEPFFFKMGYRNYQNRIIHPEYGVVTPLVLALRDKEHLESVDSPFLRLRQEFSTDMQSLDFFYSVILSGSKIEMAAMEMSGGSLQ